MMGARRQRPGWMAQASPAAAEPTTDPRKDALLEPEVEKTVAGADLWEDPGEHTGSNLHVLGGGGRAIGVLPGPLFIAAFENADLLPSAA